MICVLNARGVGDVFVHDPSRAAVPRAHNAVLIGAHDVIPMAKPVVPIIHAGGGVCGDAEEGDRI